MFRVSTTKSNQIIVKLIEVVTANTSKRTSPISLIDIHNNINYYYIIIIYEIRLVKKNNNTNIL
jgi:hypothetical protein